MNLEDILAFTKLECTGEVARAGWVLDQDAILAAISQLGIQLPVRVKFMTGKYRNGSCYSLADSHMITVDQNREINDSSFTLWHELAHCMQAERWAKSTGKPMNRWFDSEYKFARGAHGESYKGNTYEIEANKIAELMRNNCLLAFAS
jgi:hypothetical protein